MQIATAYLLEAGALFESTFARGSGTREDQASNGRKSQPKRPSASRSTRPSDFSGSASNKSIDPGTA
jgi:hypothetical protein